MSVIYRLQKVAAHSLYIEDDKYKEVGESILIPEDYKGTCTLHVYTYSKTFTLGPLRYINLLITTTTYFQYFRHTLT